MELTIRGRHFVDRIAPLVGALEQEVTAHAAVDASVGVVRLGIPLVALRWIPAVIAQLKRDMPRVEFELDVDAGMGIMQKLEAVQQVLQRIVEFDARRPAWSRSRVRAPG